MDYRCDMPKQTRAVFRPIDVVIDVEARRGHIRVPGIIETNPEPTITGRSARWAVAIDGADAEAHSWLAYALRRSEEYEGARAEADRALATTRVPTPYAGLASITLTEPLVGMIAVSSNPAAARRS